MQAECSFGFAVQHNRSKRVLMFLVPKTCLLQIIDRGTGECIRAGIAEQRTVPMLSQLREKFECNFDSCTADKCGANDKAYESIAAQRPDHLNLRIPCSAHIVATSQGRSFAPISLTVSGVIATSLVMRSGGAVGKLRAALADELAACVQIENGPPPPRGDPRMTHRDRLLDLLVPATSKAAIKRRSELKILINGSMDARPLVWYSGGRRMTKQEWAIRAAHALLPCAVPIFPQHRWLNSLNSISQYCLLFHCGQGVFERAVASWLAAVDPGAKRSRQTAAGTEQHAASRFPTTWDIDSDGDAHGLPAPHDPGGVREALSMPPPDAGEMLASPTESWQEFNEKQASMFLIAFGRLPRHCLPDPIFPLPPIIPRDWPE